MRRRAFLVAIVALASACATHAPPQSPAAAAKPAQPDITTWVAKSTEYRALMLQTYHAATAHVDEEAAHHASGTWAVILDADETVISNLQYEQERTAAGQGYSADSWTAWVKRRAAVPLPGAREFLAHVHALGGRIAIVTNRLGSECDDTIAVFKANDLAYDAMLCRPDGTTSDKNPRFAAVAAGQTDAGRAPLTVVAWVGDNILDFPSLAQHLPDTDPAFAEFGVRFFMLPNPMYGSWQ